MVWKTVERPGYFGERKHELLKSYDEKYGRGKWRIAWKWKDEFIDFEKACLLYEEAYFADSFKRESLWQELISKASDVYDNDISNVHSRFDYTKQETTATHIQDIAIRRVVKRRGWDFRGEELIQIRSDNKYWGDKLNPSGVGFHLPDLIEEPHIEGWWKKDSVEDFYQSNKVLQIEI